ncbi:MAG TPA: 4-(cytidine 5'-diphospho)-2-C-methyl-D-erythritol kinase [Rhizomicrobium sp.]|jgi:4-diphosphocytidyl-2-C-methyl-D-erythritol kinase|nr:4-(cytidine 5'-diphospho)-2-C-methyl-D-erythritol kinase [Rhizomicrobium sp.]
MAPSVNAAIKAHAKVNLFLHVGEKREDGFHPLQSLAVFGDFGDRLSVEDADDLSLVLDGPFAAGLEGGDNLVLRAARALAERAGRPAQAKITLTKNLPLASGVGGGSADAAATLRLLSNLWQLKYDEKVLRDIGATLGSDIPVCVRSQPAFMEGRGEVLSPVTSLPQLPLLLVNPRVAIPTADIFAALGERRGVGMKLPSGGFTDLADLLRFLEMTNNDLEAPAKVREPVIDDVLNALRRMPGALFTRMSGSGATCFALMPDEGGATRAAAVLKEKYPNWWVQPASVPDIGITREVAGRDIGPTPDGL